MVQTIIPRPIAWVLTRNDSKKRCKQDPVEVKNNEVLEVSNERIDQDDFNLAPYSFFTGICSDPPLVMISAGKKPSGADAHGLVVEEEKVAINIPQGVTEGVQLKVGGKGNEAPGKNSISGDLLVLIEEIPHETLKREGSNIHYDLYINFSEAVLGTSKEVETVTGKVKIKNEAGTQSGKILRLKGKGLPSIEHYGSGDFLIHTNVWTPQELNKEQKQFFEKMQQDGNFSPNPQKNDKSFFDKVKDMFS